MEGEASTRCPPTTGTAPSAATRTRSGCPPIAATSWTATIGFMVETRYLDPAEVAGIPTLDRAPAAVAYAPASSDAFKADVMLVAVTPLQATLVFEAALKAGIARSAVGATSRPSCAILPAAAKTEVITISFGCPGNRTFATVGEDEMYVAIPGARWRTSSIGDRGAAVQPHDGELLPGAGGEVLRAEVARRGTVMARSAGTLGGGGAGRRARRALLAGRPGTRRGRSIRGRSRPGSRRASRRHGLDARAPARAPGPDRGAAGRADGDRARDRLSPPGGRGPARSRATPAGATTTTPTATG